MSRILLYEFLTGGGLRSGPLDPKNASLRCEGRAMLSALAADFAAVDGVQTTILLNASVEANRPAWTNCQIVRVDSEGRDCDALTAHCREADWTVVIAPEFERILESRLRLVERSGGRLLGPSPALAALAADKQRTAEPLAASGVPAAVGRVLDVADLAAVAESVQFPAVVKPIDGCGSQDIWLLRDSESARRIGQHLLAMHSPSKKVRLERYYSGIAASVALLCGPAGMLPLPACGQRLSADGRFRYVGGRCPLEPFLAARAESLAVRAVRSFNAPLGFLGVDLVLGADPTGGDDVVIEINPRLTTSYVGLRVVAQTNLAAAMLAVAEGHGVTLSYGDHAVAFDSDGTVRHITALTQQPPGKREPLGERESFRQAVGTRR